MTQPIPTKLAISGVALSLGPPVVWSLHLLACYFLVAVLTDASTGAVRVALTITTVGALAVLVGIFFESWRSYRRKPESGDAGAAMNFLFTFSFWSNAMFVTAVLLTALPIYILTDLGEY